MTFNLLPALDDSDDDDFVAICLLDHEIEMTRRRKKDIAYQQTLQSPPPTAKEAPAATASADPESTQSM